MAKVIGFAFKLIARDPLEQKHYFIPIHCISSNMSRKVVQFNVPMLLSLLIPLMVSTTGPVNALNPRKLDETNPGGDQVKCTPACGQTPVPPPPPPPAPCPPPPALPPPSPPPPSPKKPPAQYCPPPPPPPASYIYITGPPGQLYPIDSDFSGAATISFTSLSVLIGCGLLGLLAFW